MTRLSLVIGFGLFITARSLSAQIEITAHAGVHFDRAPEHDRVLTSGGAVMYSERGEAFAFGARLSFWRRPTLGFQMDAIRSSSSSWSGYSPFPPPGVINRTTYLSARAVLRTPPVNSFQLALGLGPAVMLYGGTGTNLRTRNADVGGVIEASARLRVSGRLGVELAASNFFYGSTYVSAAVPGGSTGGATRNVFRHDLVLLPGVTYSWR